MCLSCVHKAELIGQDPILKEIYDNKMALILEEIESSTEKDYTKWNMFLQDVPEPPCEQILPGFWLEKSQIDVFNQDGYNEYPKGSYGLVEYDDPSFILIGVTPLPLPGFSEEINEEYDKGDLLFDEDSHRNAFRLKISLRGVIFSCEKFIKGCMESGWNRKAFENNEPYSISIYEWFLDHLYHFLVKYGEIDV